MHGPSKSDQTFWPVVLAQSILEVLICFNLYIMCKLISFIKLLIFKRRNHELYLTWINIYVLI